MNEFNVNEILNDFEIGEKIQEVIPVKTGHINDSFTVVTENGKKYFFQRINTAIFRDPDMLQSNIKRVTEHLRKKLAEKGYTDLDHRTMQVIPAKDGKLYVTDKDGNAWRMYSFIVGAHSLDAVTPRTAYLAGKAFGEFQNMLADLPAEELGETIPNFHNMEFRLEELEEAVKNNKAGRLQDPECQEILSEIHKRAEKMTAPQQLAREGRIPKRICHCDTKVNNMMVDDDENPVAIVDLDTVMPGLVTSDFGDFMRTAANTGAEDAKDLDTVGVNMDVYNAFAKGYLEEAAFLTPLEKELLPFGALLLTYMQTVRFFTDYLNGDTYYKIEYPEHNLQRTRAQLRLLKAQEENFDKMRDFI